MKHSFAVLVRIALPIAVAVCLAPACAQARPKATPTPAPTPAPVADPVVTKVVRQQFVAWQAGSINKSLYAPEVLPKLTDAQITTVSRALGELGPLTDTVYIGPFSAADIPAGAHGYIYQMRCSNGSVYLWLVLDADAKIATIFFKNKLDVETIENPASQPNAPPPT